MKISSSVKKLCGEKLAKFLILNFSEENIKELAKSNFNKNGRDIKYITESDYEKLKVFFNKQLEEKENAPKVEQPIESVSELLSKEGYKLYECKKFKDFDKFKKYFKQGESLCKFDDADRVNRYRVFFIVKNGADKIERFSKPDRSNNYATSVCSIQVSKDGKHITQITNRYNHAVSSPDNTFNCNLENICAGLTEAFNRDYNFKLLQRSNDVEFKSFIFRDKTFCYFVREINGTYIGNNTLIKDKITNYSDDYHYTYDHYIIDLKQCKIVWDEKAMGHIDAFVTYFNDTVKKIIFVKDINAVDDNDSDEVCYIQK